MYSGLSFSFDEFSRFSELVHQNLFGCTIVEMHLCLLIFITILFLLLGITVEGKTHCEL